ncbi:MAG: DUF192 domain-containing protein [Thermacetogeniaceae bacterium]
MEVYNVTRRVVLAERVDVAFSFWSRLKGLIGKPFLPVGHALLLRPCNSIHSFFMAFPFDALFLDDRLRIVHIIEAMPPNRISPVIRQARSVLELPAGVARMSGSRVGDQLALRACFR